jgi:fibronectin-binding autotransporter adhesin
LSRFLSALLATTALISLATLSPAQAQGGAGGGGLGGAGGLDSRFAAGDPGTDDAVNGGGGGGAGDTGGPGGAGDGPGGAGGAGPGAAGAPGADGAAAGAGGGGGAHALVDSVLPAGAITGGAGGAGGAVTGPGGGGGGGGAGGAGLVFFAIGNAGTLLTPITGGAGGAGGGTVSGQAGLGGNGGAGILFTATDGVTLAIQANVTGGAGGAVSGLGGSAIRGESLTITLGATLAGGLAGDGVTRAPALELTGGTNRLTLGAGGALQGDVALDGFAALEFAQAGDATLNSAITGFGSISKIGAGTLTLNTAGSFSAGSILSNGRVVLGDVAALGSGAITIADATLVSAVSGTLTPDLRTGFGASATLAAATGQSLTLTGSLTPGASSSLSFGATGAAGTITAEFSAVDSFDLATAGLVVAAGTLIAGNANFNDLTLQAGSTTINSGATLDLGGHLSSIANLQGNGTLTNSNLTRIGAGSFAGAITGASLSLEKYGPGTLILTGANSYGGATEISGGTLQIGDGGATGTLGASSVTNDGALVFNRADALSVANVISGSGSVTQAGSGTLTLAAANSYSGGTAITAGRLALGDIGALGSGAVSLTNATLVSNVTGSLANNMGVTDGATGGIGAAAGQVLSLTGTLSLRPGATLVIGSAGETGTVAANFAAVDFFSPATLALQVAGGTLRVGSLALNQLTQGAASVTIAAGAALDFGGLTGVIGNLQGAGTLTGTAAPQIAAGSFAGVIAGTGGFEKVGSGTLELTGANSYSGTTTITQGTLRIGAGGQLSGGGVVNNAALTFARNDTLTVGNAISGGGTLTQAGGGTLILTGANTHTGLTTINAGGTVQIGDGGTSGQISGGAVLNNGALVVNRGDAVTLGSAISGTGSLTQAGAGPLTLTGTNTYSGLTTINTGTTVRVEGAGTLGMGGVVNDGALVFARAGDLTLAGALSGSGSLTQAGSGVLTLSGANSSTGDTTITAGTLRLAGSGGLGSGALVNDGALIFDRSGALSVQGFTGMGRVEIAAGNVTFLGGASAGGTLIAPGASLQLGALGGAAGDAGSGAIVNNGTLSLARLSGPLANSLSGSGNLVASGSATLLGNNGYAGTTTINSGAVLTLGQGGTSGGIGAGAILNHGTLAVNRSDAVTLANAISGTGGLTQAGTGTLTLTGANSYSGITSVGGTLQLGVGGTAGSLGTGAVQNGGRLIFNRSDHVALDSAISGGGTLAMAGTGTLTISASYAQGRTEISAGTLRFAGGAPPFAPGAIINDAVLLLNRTDALQLETISGSGRLEVASGAVSFSPTTTTVLSGGYRIAAGASLQIDVLQSGPIRIFANLGGPTIVADGTLRVGVPRDGTLNVGQSISGSGVLRIEAGDVFLTGHNNSFSGTTVILGGLTGDARALGSSRIELQGGLLRFNNGSTDTLPNAITGEGTVRKSNSGTMILTGANSYAGRTEINQGTLQIGDGGTSGSLGPSAMSIAEGARLAFNRSDSFTVPNLISGAGELRQAGAGTTKLTSANTYSGVTRITAGTLEISAGGQLGSGAVVNDATLSFNRADAITVPNAISGTGVLRQMGVGTTTLTGANSYSGGTVIAAGTLLVAAAAHLGAAVGGLTFQGGTLATSQSFTSARAVRLEEAGGSFAPGAGAVLTLSGVLSGPGGLGMTGAGTLILRGANTHAGPTRIEAGTLMLEGPGRLSPAAVTVAAGAMLDVSRMAAPGQAIASLAGGGVVALGARGLTITAGGTEFSGRLTDGEPAGGAGGSLTIAGGVTTLTGASTYTGPTLVLGGRLVVNGSISGSSGLIVSGGTLGGSGEVPGLTIAAGGVIAPGNSIGTMQVGNLTLAAGSTTEIEVQGPLADRINVAGNAMLGGTLRLVPLGGSYRFNTPYIILRAGSVTGNFASVTTLGSFGVGVTPAVTVSATEVRLGLTAAMLLPPPAAPGIPGFLTYNLRATAGALDAANRAGGNLSPFFPIYNQPASTIGLAVNQLSGEVATTVSAMGFAAGEQFLASVLDPLGHGRESQLGGRLRPDGDDGGPLNRKRHALWGSATGAYNRTTGDATDGSASRTTRSSGFVLGFDHRVGAQSLVGLAIAVGEASASLASGQGRSTTNFGQIGAYGSTRLGRVTLAGAGAFSFMDVDTRRTLYVLNNDQQRAGFNAQVYSLRAEARDDGVRLGGFHLHPVAAIQWQQVNNAGYSESSYLTASSLGVRVQGQSQTSLRTELGAQLQGAVRIGGVPAQGFVRASWAHYWARDAAMGVGFAALPDAGFTVRGARPAANAALLSAGVEMPLAPGLTLGARLESELSGNVTQVAGTARLRYAF